VSPSSDSRTRPGSSAPVAPGRLTVGPAGHPGSCGASVFASDALTARGRSAASRIGVPGAIGARVERATTRAPDRLARWASAVVEFVRRPRADGAVQQSAAGARCTGAARCRESETGRTRVNP
jgi:hypothetical protein